MSNFLFWLWVWIGTPYCVFGLFFSWDSDFLMESMQGTFVLAAIYGLVFVTLFYSRKIARKLLNIETDSIKDSLEIFSFMSKFLFWPWIIIVTPVWIYNIFFKYTFYIGRDGILPVGFVKGTIIEIIVCLFILILFWALKRFAKKLLETKSQ